MSWQGTQNNKGFSFFNLNDQLSPNNNENIFGRKLYIDTKRTTRSRPIEKTNFVKLPFLVNDVDDSQIGKGHEIENSIFLNILLLKDNSCVCRCDKENVKKLQKSPSSHFSSPTTKQKPKIRESLIEYSIAAQTNKRKLYYHY